MGGWLLGGGGGGGGWWMGVDSKVDKVPCRLRPVPYILYSFILHTRVF